MGSGRVEVVVGRGGKSDVIKTYRNGVLVSTRYRKRGKKNRPISQPQEETKKFKKGFVESVELQEEQQLRFSEKLKGIPTLESEKEESFGVRTALTPVRFGAVGGREVIREGFNLGSRTVGTAQRLGIQPSAQIRERKLESFEFGVNVVLPVTAKGVQVLRTPTSVKFVGGATSKTAAGVGAFESRASKILQPFVKSEKTFIFKENIVGKTTLPKGEVSASRVDVVTSISQRGRGVTSSKGITASQTGTLGETPVFQQATVTKTGDKFSRSIGAGFQRDSVSVGGGITERGTQFQGAIKFVGDSKKSSSVATQLTQQQRTESIGKGITQALTPTKTPTPQISTFQRQITPTVTKTFEFTGKPTIKGLPPRTRVTTGQASSVGFKEDTRITGKVQIGEKTGGKQRPRQIQQVTPSNKVTEESQIRLTSKQTTKTREDLDLRTSLRVRPRPRPRPTPEIPITTTPTPIGTPSFYPKFSFGGDTTSTKQRKQPKGFFPSAYALTTGDKSPRISTVGVKTGLGVRGIPTKKKRKKKSGRR